MNVIRHIEEVVISFYFKGHEKNGKLFVLTFILRQWTSAENNPGTTNNSNAKLAIFLFFRRATWFSFKICKRLCVFIDSCPLLIVVHLTNIVILVTKYIFLRDRPSKILKKKKFVIMLKIMLKSFGSMLTTKEKPM